MSRLSRCGGWPSNPLRRALEMRDKNVPPIVYFGQCPAYREGGDVPVIGEGTGRFRCRRPVFSKGPTHSIAGVFQPRRKANPIPTIGGVFQPRRKESRTERDRNVPPIAVWRLAIQPIEACPGNAGQECPAYRGLGEVLAYRLFWEHVPCIEGEGVCPRVGGWGQKKGGAKGPALRKKASGFG